MPGLAAHFGWARTSVGWWPGNTGNRRGEQVAVEKDELQGYRGRRQRQHRAARVGGQTLPLRRVLQRAQVRSQGGGVTRRTDKARVVFLDELGGAGAIIIVPISLLTALAKIWRFIGIILLAR